MKLLIVTQTIDDNDPVLGFFTRWIKALSEKFESIVVICLNEGSHTFPNTVSVYSLGKEKNPTNKIVYALRFLRLIRAHKKEYDAVFVHMNQEYILLGYRWWKKWGKKIFMWRNHYAGTRWTDKAIGLCDKVFSTSKFSYTAKFPKNVLMPVGVDTELFKPSNSVARDPRAILSLGRIAPSKHIEVLLKALGELHKARVDFSLSIYGAPLPEHESYLDYLKELTHTLDISDKVQFMGSVVQSDAPALYTSHGIFVNCSQSGMYDKTIFEAAASECLVVASSEDFKAMAGEKFSFISNDSEDLAKKLLYLLSLAHIDRQALGVQLRNAAKIHSLSELSSRLAKEVSEL